MENQLKEQASKNRKRRKEQLDLKRSKERSMNEWIECINEASAWATATQLRQLFTTILTHCEVAEPKLLCESAWESLSEDIQYKRKNTKISNIAADCFSEESIHFDGNRETDETIRKVTKGLSRNTIAKHR